VVPGLGVQLNEVTQQVDIFHHPVVRDSSPYIFLVGFGLEAAGKVSKFPVLD
jgi:hypothetical protein